MNTYRITYVVSGTIDIDIDANSPEHALEIAEHITWNDEGHEFDLDISDTQVEEL